MNLALYKEFDEYKDIKEINKGWSNDFKYIATFSNKKVIIRISDIKYYEKRKQQYEYLKILNNKNLNIPRTIAFGILDNQYVYTILTYLEGEDANDIITSYSEEKQYQLGIQAGNILKEINNTKITRNKKTWYQRYQTKIANKIEKSKEYQSIIPEYHRIINYIYQNMALVKYRRDFLCHTDFHLGNMVIYNEQIYVIDFDKMGLEDNYGEFKPFIWNVMKSIPFQNGLINSYFNNKVPDQFFKVLALYAAESIISHIPWAHGFNEKEVLVALEVANQTLSYFDNFNQYIPTWYKDYQYE
ncbi:Aminoglycoside phosphotransferase [Alteracholeplasma palmae J233]|uniref:Aminoglycoside phosphotransferase n=1 Tax=Alteracholeplasma palmae (strain ATCC 49389 / J233) TaxID=1318466 RepID=U4KJU2_ALTPJ|nr:phosphotransferase [Alteracholeplasma palmae]CCV63722.1 Aminoglycoside phosphotransferase [Alteracholeplasma palmae J233]